MSNVITVAGNDVKLPPEIEVVSASEKLFLVPYPMTYVNRPEVREGGVIDFTGITVFFNPRRLTGQGFDHASMYELYEDVREDGLLRNFFARWRLVDGSLKVEVLDGERRHITVGKMRDKNDLVFCRRLAKMLPAQDVFSKVLMVIHDLDEDAAHRMTYSVSERQVPWGEGSNARLIRHWRECGEDDEKILKKTRKTGQWLREQDQINGLDEKTFNYLCEQKINRSFALRMVKIDDIEERHRYLDAGYADAVERHAKSVQKKKDDVSKAEDGVELAEAMVLEADAGLMPMDKAQAQLAQAQQNVEEKKKDLANVEPPQAKTPHLRRGARKLKENDEGEVATTTTPAAQETLGLPIRVGQIRAGRDKIEDVIKAGGKVGQRTTVPVLFWLGAKAALEAVLGGEEDIVLKVTRTYQRDHLLLARSGSRIAEADAQNDHLDDEQEQEEEEENLDDEIEEQEDDDE